MRTIDQGDAGRIRAALTHLRHARNLLVQSGARKAAARVRGVLHSVEGAARHAELVARRDGGAS